MEDLAHDIAANSADKVSIELAREAAEAVLELDRVRRFKVTFITRVSAFETSQSMHPQCFEHHWTNLLG